MLLPSVDQLTRESLGLSSFLSFITRRHSRAISYASFAGLSFSNTVIKKRHEFFKSYPGPSAELTLQKQISPRT